MNLDELSEIRFDIHNNPIAKCIYTKIELNDDFYSVAYLGDEKIIKDNKSRKTHRKFFLDENDDYELDEYIRPQRRNICWIIDQVHLLMISFYFFLN